MSREYLHSGPLSILQNESVTFPELFDAVIERLKVEYTIFHPGKEDAIFAVLLLFYYYPTEKFKPCHMDRILKKNGIVLDNTANGRTSPKNNSRRLSTAIQDLAYLGVILPWNTRWQFNAILNKKWLEDKPELTKRVKRFHPNLELKPYAIDWRFTNHSKDWEDGQ